VQLKSSLQRTIFMTSKAPRQRSKSKALDTLKGWSKWPGDESEAGLASVMRDPPMSEAAEFGRRLGFLKYPNSLKLKMPLFRNPRRVSNVGPLVLKKFCE
jgi:hypothetical protein